HDRGVDGRERSRYRAVECCRSTRSLGTFLHSLRNAQDLPLLGPAPRRSALRKNRRLSRAKGTEQVTAAMKRVVKSTVEFKARTSLALANHTRCWCARSECSEQRNVVDDDCDQIRARLRSSPAQGSSRLRFDFRCAPIRSLVVW